MIKNALLILATVISLSSAAKASTVDVLLGATTNEFYYGSVPSLTPDVNLTNTPALSVSGNAGVESSSYSVPGYFQAPTGPTYGNSYVAVDAGGSATLHDSQNGNAFGFTWGSIDAYNSLIVTSSTGVTYTITGSDILSQLPPGQDQTNVVVNDPYANIVKVQLETTSNAFEASNFGGSTRTAVPLPASAVLFGFAMMGLVFMSRRRQDIA